jgi:hypothetical protein
MTRSLRHVAFALGLAAICWVGVGYVGTNTPALVITTLIGAFYLTGGWELHRFQQATLSLSRSLANLSGPPASLAEWLGHVHPSLQSVVRLRVEGERAGLPRPPHTPFHTGQLVLLGMLGTILGMVVTQNGTGSALESASDLQAIRASLAAPVKGLGLAFGTSLAGVAASAMLGLVSALCRRERLQAGQALDSKISTSLRAFSGVHQREQSLRLLEQQTHAMPGLVDRLQLMMAAMERQSEALNARLVSNQEAFHAQAEGAYARLAVSVGRSLNESLVESARVAGSTIQPVVEATMAGISREASSLNDSVRRSVAQQLDGLASRFEATTATVADIWRSALADHQRTSGTLSADLHARLGQVAAGFEQRSALLLLETEKAHATLQSEGAARDLDRLAAWSETLQSVALSLAEEWRLAGEQASKHQQAVVGTLEHTAADLSAQAEAHARNTVAEVVRLVDAASDAQRTATEVAAQLRQKVADHQARDDAMLEERSRLLQAFGTVLDGVAQASKEQRSAVDALVAHSSDVLERVASHVTKELQQETDKIGAVAAQVGGSAVEVASLGEAFGLAVQLFCESNDKLGAHLLRIEAALGKAAERSDEQLGYYVAQAREVIDLSMLSQRHIVEELQQLAGRRAPVGSEA